MTPELWIPVVVQVLILAATIYTIRARAPKQTSEIRVDTTHATENITTSYDRILAEKEKQLAERDRQLAEAQQQAALVPQQAKTIEGLEGELRNAKIELATRQDLTELRALIPELLAALKHPKGTRAP